MTPAWSCLPDLFKAQAAETPDGLAIVSGRERMSYSALDRASDSLGAYLRYRGVSPDEPVGIFMETCSEYIVATIGNLESRRRGSCRLTSIPPIICSAPL